MNFYKEISERFTQVFQRCKYFLSSKQVCPSHMSFRALLNLKKPFTHAKVIWTKCHNGRNVGLSEDEILDCFDHPGSEVLECIITFAEKPAVPFHYRVLSCPLRAQLTQDKQQQSPLSE